jgi:hypothetical protein
MSELGQKRTSPHFRISALSPKVENLQSVLKPAHRGCAPHDRIGARPDEYKPNGSRHGRSRIAVIPVEKQSDPCACQAEPNQFTGVSRDGVHCDQQKFAERLV